MAAFGMTIPIDADASSFNKELKKMDRSIRTTSGEIKDLSKSLKIEWNSKVFVEAQRKAQEALKQTEVKAQSLRDRLRYLDENKTDKTSNEYQKLQSQLIKTETAAVEMKAKLQEINDLKLDRVTEQFRKVGDGITKAGQAMAPLSAAAAALVGGFAKIGLSAVKAGDYIGTTAQQLNLSTTELQRWLYIANQTDVEAAQFVNAVTKMQGALAHLAAGEEDITASALKELGISAEEASLGMEANFEKIINGLANLEDSTMQAYYANELFGTRMGAKLIPLLNDGGNGLASLSAEFEALGYISDENVQKLDAFDDLMDKLKYQFTLIKNEIGALLLPIMEKLAQTVQDKIIPAFQELRNKLAGLSETQIENGLKILTLVASIAPVLMIVGKLTSSVGSLIKIMPMLGQALTVLAAHPIIAVIAVLVGLMVHLYNTNEQFRNSINSLVQSLMKSLKPILDLVINLVQNLLKSLMPIINVLSNVVLIIGNVLFPILTKFIDLISKFLVPVIETIGKVFTFQFELIQKIFNGIIGFIEDSLNGAIDFINSIIRQINKLGDVLGFTIQELDNVALKAEITQEVKTVPSTSSGITSPNTSNIPDVSESDFIQDTINNLDVNTMPQTIVNNDNSIKDITIEVVVNNYGDEIDAEELAQQINLKLAEAM
jgi:biopolymer transport protein ExbB/TolQ